MKLTPLDIRKQEFKRSMRGFDPIEVEAFLQMVADEFEVLIRERNRLEDELLKLRTQLKDYQEVEKTLRETLVTAQQTVNESRENSRREADLLIRNAELRAESILEETREELGKLKNDVRLAKAQKESFTRRLRHLLESQLELLGVLEIDDVGLELDDDHPVRVKSRRRTPLQMDEEIDLDTLDDFRDEHARSTAAEPRIVRNTRSNPEQEMNPNLSVQKNQTKLTNVEKPGDVTKSKISDQIIM